MSELTDNTRITTNWNEVDSFHKTPHKGVDLSTKTGTKIIAQDPGQVQITTDQWIGVGIRLKMANGDIVVYGHTSEQDVANGQMVNAGDLLGLTGGAVGSKNSGLTTGEHVHVALIHEGVLSDPTNYLFHHGQVQTNSSPSSPFLFPVILILLAIIFYKFRKFFIYGALATLVLGIIFIVS